MKQTSVESKNDAVSRQKEEEVEAAMGEEVYDLSDCLSRSKETREERDSTEVGC